MSSRPPKRDDRVPGGVRLFAHAVPGLGRLIAAEIDATNGMTLSDNGFDGRSDVVLFTATTARPRPAALGMAEDLFVEVGRTRRSEGDRAPWIARRLWRPTRAEQALADLARIRGSVRDTATYRVITRVLQERSFLRTDLRRQIAGVVQRAQPRWRVADPAEVEIWIVEYQPGRLLAGLRASDVRMRQHDGRSHERHGALRPTVAAAMVRQAGPPGSELLDPCCGTGTILAEARAAGWQPIGRDIDPDAVHLAARNVPGAAVSGGDARHLDLPAASIDAVVANLPFGRQYEVAGDMDSWLHAFLAECARVTRPGGRVVLLAPSIPPTVRPGGLRLARRVPIRLLGTRAAIWVYDRR